MLVPMSFRPSPYDLTVVSNVQDNLAMPLDAGTMTPRSDTLNRIQRMLTACSMWLVRLMFRDTLLLQQFTERRNGNNGPSLRLRNWPIRSVLSLVVDGYVIPASPDGVQPGYTIDDTQRYIWLVGTAPTLGIGAVSSYWFNRGRQNVSPTYTAGWVPVYAPVWSPATAYTSYAFALDLQGNMWQCVAGGTSGSTGPGPADGTCSWAQAIPDANPLLVFEQGVIEIVSQKWKRSVHVDEKSHTLDGQSTVSFSEKDIPEETRLLIETYKNVVPIWG